MITLIWVQAMIIWMRKPLLLRCETRIAILLCTLFKPLCPKQNKELRLEFAALNLFCFEFALLLIITTSCLISLYRVIVNAMEKYEEEEIPLLDFETGLDSEDAKSYFEAFKEFDHKNTGHISIRVYPLKAI